MSELTVSKNKVVAFTYCILDQVGDLFEQSDLPLEYIHGCENDMFEKVELALEGKTVGSHITIQLSPEEGFGYKDPKLIITDLIENAPEEFRYLGAKPSFENDNGDIIELTVVHVDNEKITIDGNHPLADQTVTFKITVVAIRDALSDELRH